MKKHIVSTFKSKNTILSQCSPRVILSFKSAYRCRQKIFYDKRRANMLNPTQVPSSISNLMISWTLRFCILGGIFWTKSWMRKLPNHLCFHKLIFLPFPTIQYVLFTTGFLVLKIFFQYVLWLVFGSGQSSKLWLVKYLPFKNFAPKGFFVFYQSPS